MSQSPDNTVVDSANAPQPLTGGGTRKRTWLAVLVLVLATMLVFEHVRTQAFVQWDDSDHVYKNMYLNPVTASGVQFFWQHDYKHLYIPLSYTVFAGLALIAHRDTPIHQITDGDVTLDPSVFHIASLLAHLVNVLLVFGILRLLLRRVNAPITNSPWPAALGALLFAIHPVQVESVAWVSELRGLLAGFFTLLALLLYLRGSELSIDASGRRAAPLVASIAAAVLMALGILCKPSAVTMPLIALALDLWALRRPWRRCLLHALPTLLVGIAFAIVTRHIQPQAKGVVYPLWGRPFIVGDSLAFYLAKLLIPRDLGIIYGRTPEYVMAHWWGFATWLVPAAIGVFLWVRRRTSPWLLAAAGVSIAALLPVLGFLPFLFQHFSTVADRYLYLAMIGPAYAAARLLARHWGSRPAAVACAVLAALGVVSTLQVRTWDNTVTLQTQALAVNPHIVEYYGLLAAVLEDQGKPDEAVEMYRAGVRNNPGDKDALFSLASCLMRLDKAAEAVPVFQRIVTLFPNEEQAHFGLASTLFRLGRRDEAVAEFEAAARLAPSYAMYRAALGSALAAAGRREEAITELKAALQLQPDYPQVQAALKALKALEGR
jgi:tetratricopeptide (TPR) repeat protein